MNQTASEEKPLDRTERLMVYDRRSCRLGFMLQPKRDRYFGEMEVVLLLDVGTHNDVY